MVQSVASAKKSSSEKTTDSKKQERIAIVVGATGLVGQEIVRNLLADSTYTKVKTFVRRRSGQESWPGAGKLEESVVDFAMIEAWKHLLTGTVLFSSLGTTIKQAGSQEEQYKIDYQYQWDIAHAARENEVFTYVLISSTGASVDSPFFYLRTKGELEKDVEILGFKKLRILRPASLKGHRPEKRTGEEVSTRVLESIARLAQTVLSRESIDRWRPIDVKAVARAALTAARIDHPGTLIYGPADLHRLATDPST